MLKVGITGGIGSGKTTVCKIFETLGIPVYYADQRAKWLMTHDEELIAQIKKLFGDEAYGPDGALNRAYIAGIVFQDKNKLSQLNALVHPAVARDSEQWQTRQRGAPYTLKEAAIMFESGSHRQLDRIITVTAPEELRIARVMQRDGTERSAVEDRIRRQMPESERIKRSDFVIYNDGSRSIVRQVVALHRRLIKLKLADRK